MAKKKKSATALIAGGARRAIAAMNPKLKKLYNSCVEIVATLESNNVLGRFKLGREIYAAMDEKTYGEGAANKLSEALGIQTAELYRCRQVAQTWSEDELHKLLGRKVAGSKKVITWGHLYVIASVRDNKRFRGALVTKFFKEGTTVRDLQATIQQKLGMRGNNRVGRGRVAPRSPLAGLASLHRLSESILTSQDQFDEAIFDSLSQKPGDYASPELVEHLQTALDEQKLLEGVAGANRRKISAALQATQNALKSKPKSTPARSSAAKEKRRGVKKKVKRSPAAAIKAARGQAGKAGKSKIFKKKKVKRRRAPATAA